MAVKTGRVVSWGLYNLEPKVKIKASPLDLSFEDNALEVRMQPGPGPGWFGVGWFEGKWFGPPGGLG
jgi:hypothetical protein